MPEQDGEPTETAGGASPEAAAGRVRSRHREHQFPGRPHRAQPRFTDEERAAKTLAAGLTTTGYVGAAAVAAATGTTPPTPSLAREALAELMEARLQVRRFAVNVNQAAKAVNAGAEPPEWLDRAVALTTSAVRRVGEATDALMRRLP